MLFLAEGLVLWIMELAQFPEADAFIEELAVVFLQLAIGFPEVVILQMVIAASL